MKRHRRLQLERACLCPGGGISLRQLQRAAARILPPHLCATSHTFWLQHFDLMRSGWEPVG